MDSSYRVPDSFAAPITMFLPRDTYLRESPEDDPRRKWKRVGDVEIHEVPGRPSTYMREPQVRKVAGLIRAHYRKASLTSAFRSRVSENSDSPDSGRTDGPDPLLVAINPSGSKPPFFCVPGVVDLARLLGADQPFYGINLRDIEEVTDSQLEVETFAKRCIAAIKAIQPNGPYFVGGHSLGGAVAFEIAQQLQKQGCQVGAMVLLDPVFPTSALVNRVQPDDEKNPAVEGAYRVQFYPGHVTLILAGQSKTESDPRLAWSKLATTVDIYEISGDHSTFFSKANLRELARILLARLDRASIPMVSFASHLCYEVFKGDSWWTCWTSLS